MERILDVAQYVYDEYKKMSGTVIDEMKLHKLLYLIQRESFAILNHPMFAEPFEGWKYGPVSREVRVNFTPDGIVSQTRAVSEENAYIVRNILMQYAPIETWELSRLTHNEISWANARKGLTPSEAGTRELALEDIAKDSEKVRPYDSVWDMYYDEFDDEESVAV